jgi:SAM-dependent methyltransferase
MVRHRRRNIDGRQSEVAAIAGFARRLVISKDPDSSNLDPLRRFSDRVEDYVRYRPSYPAEVIPFLRAKAGLAATSVVADVGAGTGIFTRMLLDTGAMVTAVEPNDAMRGAAEVEFRSRANFKSAKGTAEATGLADGSVSLITCAQAFHWFEPSAARNEFRRILEPDGWCTVIWNMAIVDASDFAIGYESLKEDFGTDFKRVRHETIEKAGRFDAFFGVGKWGKQNFENFQILDFKGLKGRLLSSSYAPKEGHPRYEAMIAALMRLYDRCQKDGVVRMEYKTEVYFGQLA